MTDATPILPGMESAMAEMDADAMTDAEVDKLPTFTAERVANYDPKRYALAARLLFAENISRRTICKWLHMSPNTLAAIEARELRIHPERIAELQAEATAEIAQLKRIGREELRARFFDKEAMKNISAKEIASILKTLEDMSVNYVQKPKESNRNAETNDYIEAIATWSEDGFGGEKNSAPGSLEGLEVEARKNDETGAKAAENGNNELGTKSNQDGSMSGEVNSTELNSH